MAADYRDDDCAVLCCLGDGATSEGDFHEGLNFAGVFDRVYADLPDDLRAQKAAGLRRHGGEEGAEGGGD
jgi:TPP-dependent pyruvate/acetoin dehydrogenase alpha subunit